MLSAQHIPVGCINYRNTQIYRTPLKHDGGRWLNAAVTGSLRITKFIFLIYMYCLTALVWTHHVIKTEWSHSTKSYVPSSSTPSFPRCLQVSGINASMSRKREQRVLFMVVVMVICYLLCWLPYGIMALLATFGPPGLVTPEASIIPSVLAKTSTVINPVIYVFMNKQVRMSGREGWGWGQCLSSFAVT